MNKIEKVFIVINDGCPVFASYDKEDADNYAATMNDNEIDEALSEMGIDDPDEKDIDDAAFKAGYDNYFGVESGNIAGKSDDDEIELSEGSEVNVGEIRDLLKKSKKSED